MKLDRVISRISRGIWYLPKTIYLNFKTLPLKNAFHFPYIVMGKCRIRGINKRNFVIEGPISPFMIHFGTQKTAKRGIPVNKTTSILIDDGGTIVFHGKATFGQGSSICCSGGSLEFGDMFSCNVNCFIYCKKRIIFGFDNLLGWNINIRDNDGHPMYNNFHKRTNPDADIVMGNRVWIGSYVDVLKGVSIADGTIIATRSLVSKSNKEENSIIAGIPARLVKKEVFWEHN